MTHPSPTVVCPSYISLGRQKIFVMRRGGRETPSPYDIILTRHRYVKCPFWTGSEKDHIMVELHIYYSRYHRNSFINILYTLVMNVQKDSSPFWARPQRISTLETRPDDRLKCYGTTCTTLKIKIKLLRTGGIVVVSRKLRNWTQYTCKCNFPIRIIRINSAVKNWKTKQLLWLLYIFLSAVYAVIAVT